MESWKRKLRMGMVGGGQIATGEENNLWIRIYASKGAIVWRQENPNYLEVYRYGKPRQTMTRASDYLSTAAQDATRIPTGHPEGYLEAFASIYCGAIEAIRKHIDGNPLNTDEYHFPTVYDGLRGMQFNYKAAEQLYTDDWQAFIKQKYGTMPSVTYFASPVIVDNLVGQIIMDEQ